MELIRDCILVLGMQMLNNVAYIIGISFLIFFIAFVFKHYIR